jgi:hypothetical protein
MIDLARRPSRWWLPVVVLLLAGCGTTSNTLAQDLAYQRVEQCRHITNVIVTRIEPDGRVWTEVRNGTVGYAEWRECMNKAYQDQATKGSRMAGSSVGPRPTAARSTPANGSAAPILSVGEEWAFRWESPTGRGTYIMSVTREERLDGVDCYVTKIGEEESFYRKTDLALVREVRDGGTVSHQPPRPQFSWPLTVGKAWEQVVSREDRTARTSRETTWAWEVQGEESVTVPAGTFQAVKIVARNKRGGSLIYEMWYAPDVKLWVRLLEHLQPGVRERELLAFRTRGSA